MLILSLTRLQYLPQNRVNIESFQTLALRKLSAISLLPARLTFGLLSSLGVKPSLQGLPWLSLVGLDNE
jgi:hypothetical protein